MLLEAFEVGEPKLVLDNDEQIVRLGLAAEATFKKDTCIDIL